MMDLRLKVFEIVMAITTPIRYNIHPPLPHEPLKSFPILCFRVLYHIFRHRNAFSTFQALTYQPIPQILLVKACLRLANFVSRRGPEA